MISVHSDANETHPAALDGIEQAVASVGRTYGSDTFVRGC